MSVSNSNSVRVQRAVLTVTALAAFVSFLDATIVNIAFPSIETTFSSSSRAAHSWILSAYAIVFAALLVPAGGLADLVGRKRVFLWGLALFTAASAACAAAPSVGALVAARAVQAIGAAALVPTSLALLLPVFPPERRGTAIGLWGAAAAVAAASGPPLGGLLVDLAGWRWVFLVNLPLGIATILLGRRVLSESRDEHATGAPDPLGTAFVAAAAGVLALAIVQGSAWGWASWRITGAFALAIAGVAAFVARSRRHPAPAIDLSLFASRGFTVANAATLAFATAFFAMLLCNVLFLTGVWGWSVLTAGIATVPSPLMAAITAGPAGRIADRVGTKPVILAGAVAYVAGAAWLMTRTGLDPDYVGIWLPGALLVGTGIGLAYPTLGAAAAASLPPDRFGVGSAVNAMARQLGAVLGIALVVAIVGTPSPAHALTAFHHGWALAIGSAALCFVVSLALPGRAREVASFRREVAVEARI